ncbi:MAG TPA: DUF2510 domain-containing protein [Solirubrobacterales bacterium]|nr:DUF2510 domain-containing protein [Solirubrobacterales bacterium]
MGMADRGWYPDPQPEGDSGLRYWDGQHWTAQTRPSPDSNVAATPPKAEGPTERLIVTREVPGRGPVRLHPAIWILLGVATLGILLGAAEQHDQTCYSKAAVQAVSGNRELEGCLLLPWNDAVAPPMVPKSSDRRR